MDWNKIFTGILPLLGVIVGGYITYLTQTKTLNKQFKREVDKDRESKNIERLKIYGEVLKLDGEYLMVEYDRLRLRGEAEGNWCYQQSKKCIEAYKDEYFEQFIETDHSSIDAIVQRIQNEVSLLNA